MHEKYFRRCVACRNSFNQLDMIRLAKINGDYLFDFANKLGGRGAYVCKNADCLALTIKKHLFNRAFKTNLPNEIYGQLEEYAQNNQLSGVCKKIK